MVNKDGSRGSNIFNDNFFVFTIHSGSHNVHINHIRPVHHARSQVQTQTIRYYKGEEIQIIVLENNKVPQRRGHTGFDNGNENENVKKCTPSYSELSNSTNRMRSLCAVLLSFSLPLNFLSFFLVQYKQDNVANQLCSLLTNA